MKPVYAILASLIILVSPAGLRAQENINNKWERFLLKSSKIDNEFRYYSYSSELDEVNPFEGGFGKYSIINLYDNNPATAWVEGVKGHGIGENIFVGLGDKYPDKIVIRNGYQKSENIYRSNSRPKTIKLSIYLGLLLEGDVTEIEFGCYATLHSSFIVEDLKDSLGIITIEVNEKPSHSYSYYLDEFKTLYSEEIQELSRWNPDLLKNIEHKYLLKIEILDVYKGSRWDDTCISDIWTETKGDDKEGIPSEDIIEDIYESDDLNSGIIFVDTHKEKKLILVDRTKLPEYKILEKGESLDLVLMDVSKDKEWAQINYMFHQEGAGKVEEYSVLYHTRSLKRVSPDILKEIYGAYGFVFKEGIYYLDTADGLINLNKIKAKINLVY